VLGSLEYAVSVLNVPLIVVLGHDACGAVAAAIDAAGPSPAPLSPHIAKIVNSIVPAVKRVTQGDGRFRRVDASEVGREHLRDTIADLLRSSELITDAIAAGTLAVVGANYRLLEGRVVPDVKIGLT
jgi:carbonic anhydrase